MALSAGKAELHILLREAPAEGLQEQDSRFEIDTHEDENSLHEGL